MKNLVWKEVDGIKFLGKEEVDWRALGVCSGLLLMFFIVVLFGK